MEAYLGIDLIPVNEVDWDLVLAATDPLGAPMQQTALVPLQPQFNNPFGIANIYPINQNVLESNSANAVPVFNMAADIRVLVNTTVPNIVSYCFKSAYRMLLESQGVSANASDYAQIRLLQMGNMQYDLTSDMLSVDDVLLDFINLYFLMIQSETDPIVDRNLGTMQAQFEFRFTFVLGNGVSTTINEQNIGKVKTFGNAMASNSRQRQTNVMAARSRYIQQRTHNYTGRQNFNVVSDVFSTQPQINIENVAQLKAVRSQVEREIRREIPKKKKPRTPAIRNVSSGKVKEKRKREREPWSDEQRAIYNANRKAKRQTERGEVRGIYELLKKKIFHHTSLDDYFLNTKAVLKVPTEWDEGYCLAMAFLKSECRTYSSDGSQILESDPCILPNQKDYDSCPILENFESQLIGNNCDFIHDDEIVLFNPYKYPSEETNSAFKYAAAPKPNLVKKWYLAAQNVHQFVCHEIDCELDPNCEDTLQAYSDVFEVYICVYHLEVQGKRAIIFKPHGFHADVRKRKEFRVVSILIGDNHATAITSLREFLRTKASANRSTIHNYCVFCEKNSTANNETIAESKKHFVACCNKKGGQLICCGNELNRSKMVSDIAPAQFHFDRKTKTHLCRLCRGEIVGGLDGQMEHVCYMNKPENLKLGESKDIYVYDLECAQIKEPESNVFIHDCNLVCVRRAYPDENGDCDRHSFKTIDEFVKYVMQFTDQPRIYIAHNGSKYDAQFVVKYLERNLIPHTFIPAPSSMHAYLSVTISFGSKASATFIDFRHFVPGSLKNIGISFGLSVSKGDFPHHFNNGFHDYYEGGLPILDHPSDYWCLGSKRSQEDIDEFLDWYALQEQEYCTCDFVCTCLKKKWNFEEELLKYCWLDVDVLAEACVKYRNNALEFGVEEESNEGWVSKGIDPFQYLTIPQLALNLLLGGAPEEEQVTITLSKSRRERCSTAIGWMNYQMQQLHLRILHIGNSHREYFCPKTHRFLDGVTMGDNKHVFVCLNCTFHACPTCFDEEIQTGIDHPCRPGTYGTILKDTTTFISDLLACYGTEFTHITWAHEFELHPYEHKLGDIMKERDMFYGGRTEVFSAYVNADLYPEDTIQYHDVCSLYPYVCAFKELPTGHPEHIIGLEINRARVCDLNHPDRYFGYVRCLVRPNKEDKIGLLPYRDPVSGRLEFPLNEMTGSWGTQELELAIEQGYEVLEIYEVYHWTKEERSDTLLRGYVSFFLRMKQESEGWKKLGGSSETPDEEEQQFLVDKVYRENGNIARIRPDRVGKNPVKRQMAKLFLNSLWGKFCQKPHSENYVVIHGYQEFAALWFDPNLDKSKFSFRHISGQTWKVKYNHLTDWTRPNAKYNIFLSSKVTEWARCVLHRQMIKIGKERILYCDTDSIMFLWPKLADKLDGVGLGNWVNEYPTQTIKRLYALAPKFYYLEFADDHLLKSKGIQMSMHNQSLIHGVSLGKQLLEKFFPRTTEDGQVKAFTGYIPMRNMLMGINATNPKFEYGTMMTRYTQDKKLGPVFSKRQLVYYVQHANVEYDESFLDRIKRIETIPKGYYLQMHDVSLNIYAYLTN